MKSEQLDKTIKKAEQWTKVRFQFSRILVDNFDDFSEAIIATSFFLGDIIMNGADEDVSRARGILLDAVIPAISQAINERREAVENGISGITVSEEPTN